MPTTDPTKDGARVFTPADVEANGAKTNERGCGSWGRVFAVENRYEWVKLTSADSDTDDEIKLTVGTEGEGETGFVWLNEAQWIALDTAARKLFAAQKEQG